MSNAPATITIPDWSITDRLRKAREIHGWTQTELAERSLGRLKLRTISNYEKPDYDSERKDAFVAAWAFATGVPFEWLMTGTNPTDGGDNLVTRDYPDNDQGIVYFLKAS